MFFNSKKVVGLDIGTSSIKMAELDLSRGGATLQAFGITPTPSGSMYSGEISSPNAIAQAIKSLAAEIKSKRKNVSTGMWGTAVIVKKITIPKVEQKLVAQQVRWEAEQYIPFDINEISLSYHIVQNATTAEAMDIILVGAQNALVYQYQACVVSAGLNLSVLDVSGFALANTFELNYGKVPGQTIALLNIGASVTNLVMITDGEVVFSRDIPIGGLNYTNEIHKELGVSVTEAESLKMAAAHKQEVPEQVHSVISSVTGSIAEEVRNSFDFFAASGSGVTINKCYFTGGVSSTPQLINRLAEAVSVEFQPLNPFARVKPGKALKPQYLQQVAPFAAIVVGLGLRKLGDS